MPLSERLRRMKSAPASFTRLKLKMMQKEMPRRYWHNLPEAQFISTLSASAAQRQGHMLADAPSLPKRRIPVFRATGEAAARLQVRPHNAPVAINIIAIDLIARSHGFYWSRG